MIRLPILVLTLSALAAFGTSPASAATAENTVDAGPETPATPSTAQDGSWRPRVGVALGAGGTSGAFIAGSVRATAGVEPSPFLYLGAAYRAVRGTGDADGYLQSYDTDMFAAALEVHFAGNKRVDPYVAADLGYAFYSFDSGNPGISDKRSDGLAAAAGVGLSFRWKHVSFGPQLSYLTVPAASTSSALLDLNLDVRF